MSIDPESSFFDPPDRAHGLVLVDPVAMPFWPGTPTAFQPYSPPAPFLYSVPTGESDSNRVRQRYAESVAGMQINSPENIRPSSMVYKADGGGRLTHPFFLSFFHSFCLPISSVPCPDLVKLWTRFPLVQKVGKGPSTPRVEGAGRRE